MNFLLLLTHFFWIFRFRDKKLGFVCTLSFFILIQVSIAVVSQLFGFFEYKNILIINIIISLFSLFLNIKYFKKDFFNGFFNEKYLIFFIAITIIFTQFYLVHFRYSGELATYNGIVEVENFNPKQPYFSDEWIAISMSEKVIESKNLPLINPLDNTRFYNFLFVFHSLIAQFDLFLNLNLINDYSWLSIIFSLITLVFIYILLIKLDISNNIALLTIFLISYLPNSSNLPLLWYLLPWNLGFIFLIAFFIMVEYKKYWLAYIFNIASIVFYPPIMIFSIPSFFALIFRKISYKILVSYLATLISGFFISLFIISKHTDQSYGNVVYKLSNLIIRPLENIYGVAPSFLFWDVVPFICVPFVFIGIVVFFKKYNYILVTFYVGFVLWILYSLNFKTFFADYHRVVAISAILAMIIFSITFNFLYKNIKYKISFLNSDEFSKIINLLILVIFFVALFSFTGRQGWKDFKTLNIEPMPPANNYLTEDDLNLFKDINNERFIAPPWKGLVIAVATKNLPLSSKASTLTMNIVDYYDFIKLDCYVMTDVLNFHNTKYVYIPEKKCSQFKELGKSREGLVLYLIE